MIDRFIAKKGIVFNGFSFENDGIYVKLNIKKWFIFYVLIEKIIKKIGKTLWQ